MRCHDTLQKFPAQFASAPHVKSLEQLRDLKVKRLIPLLLVKLGDLPLYFFHDLDFTLEEFGE